MSNATQLRFTSRQVADLRPYPGNCRSHSDEQIAQIAASIQQFGWTNPILIGPDNLIIAGHARWLSARHLHLEEVPVIVVSGLTSVQRKALAIADNRLALNAGWDEEKLRLELDELRAADFDLDLLGFGVRELERLWADLDDFSESPADADRAAERPDDRPVTAAGEMWQLGAHRLLCADGADRSHMDRLLSGERADLLYTEFPDSLAYEGRNPEQSPAASQGSSNAIPDGLVAAVFSNCSAVLKPTASLYIAHTPLQQSRLQPVLAANGLAIHGQIIFARTNPAKGSRYRLQHEPMLYAHVAGHRDRWYGRKTESSLWQEPEDHAHGSHSLTGFVCRAERAITNSSRKRNLVLDPFAGSESTLLACERTGRRARLLAINPRTCDAIVEAWHEFTGGRVVLDGSKSEFKDLASERLHTTAEDHYRQPEREALCAAENEPVPAGKR